MKAGIDDFGSGEFYGFACVIAGDQGAIELNSRGREILAAGNIDEFHGSQLNVENADEVRAYEEFAAAIKKTLTTHGEYAAFRLLHRNLFRTLFKEFSRRVAGNVLTPLTSRVPEFALDKQELSSLLRKS